ncbi:Prophage tail length tape measure protein [Afipia felis]|uniref:Prophage tail length tape measure protein n=1 Tax=Afipia felis TaxID=1035 RepID=A0A090MQR5_AFIFE|nr:phage tail length tape measure family protein [Afipia felis]CEG09720.1 Prophage tail length tape measure protein [Afipia felis]
MRAQIDPLGAAQKKLNAEISEANALYKAGAISAKEQAAAHALAQARYDSTARALGGIGSTGKLASHQLANLSYQLNDVFVSLASGQSPLMVLIQQGSQIAQVMGPVGVTGTIKGVTEAITSIVTPARFAAGAIIGLAAGAATAYETFLRHQKQVEAALLGAGRIAGATIGDINRIVATGASAGNVSVAAARDMAIAFLRTGRIGKEHFESLIAVAKNYAVTVGTDVDGAVKALADAFADPVRGAETLNNQLGFLDDRTRQYIRRLVEQNDRTSAQRVLLDAMRGSLANAETATTALSRAWDAVKRAASNAFDAVGRVIDRASGGGSPEEQLVRIEQQLAALSRGGGAPSSVLANLRRQADELRAKITEARRQADIGRIEADARELSLKVGDAVRQVVPGAETIRQLEGLRSSLGRLLEDPLAARHVDNLQGVENAYRRVTQALQSYSGENIRFLDPQERKLRLQQIEIALINATTPAQRAALEAERARIELIGQSVTPEQAALSVQQARQRVFAESARFIRDYVRDQQFAIEQTQAEITFIGKSVEEKDKFIARLKAEQDLRRQGISAASAEGQMILANAGRQAALNAQLDRARELVQGWQSVFDSSMNRVADLLVQGQRDWQSWLDAGRAAIADIHRELLKLAVLNPLKNLLSGTGAPTLSTAGGLLGSLFGSGGMGLGPVASAARLFGSPIYHLGGVTGDVAPMRFVPASVFQGAPRLHDGAFLSPDEVPASRTAFSDWIIALPNRLDEITSVIGNIEAEVHNLCASAEQHRENREKFESFSQRVEKIEADMKPLGKTVATMADRLRATL